MLFAVMATQAFHLNQTTLRLLFITLTSARQSAGFLNTAKPGMRTCAKLETLPLWSRGDLGLIKLGGEKALLAQREISVLPQAHLRVSVISQS